MPKVACKSMLKFKTQRHEIQEKGVFCLGGQG